IGSEGRVEFIRDGQTQTVNVELAERPDSVARASRIPDNDDDDDSQPAPAKGRLGVLSSTVTPEVASQLRLQNPSGALVMSVNPGSAAALAGIRHGDVIHKVDREEIRTSEDLARVIAGLKPGQYQFEVEHKSKLIYPVVTLP